jgi:hypothetical protein
MLSTAGSTYLRNGLAGIVEEDLLIWKGKATNDRIASWFMMKLLWILYKIHHQKLAFETLLYSCSV